MKSFKKDLDFRTLLCFTKKTPLVAGPFQLWVSAGSQVCSRPNIDSSDPWVFTAFELAIGDKDGTPLAPNKDKRLQGFVWASYFVGEPGTKAAWVPTEVIQQIYDDLSQWNGLHRAHRRITNQLAKSTKC